MRHAARILRPISGIWSVVAKRRYRRTAPYRPKLPVICVGNFTAGGAGKTPLAIAVVEQLKALGHRPAFLSRGYGGKLAGPHNVDGKHDCAVDVGDEPLLLASHAPTMIARDKIAGARAIEASSADVIVMDDGLQNPTLSKDLTLAVIDDARGVGNGQVIPAGPLRVPLDFQLGLTDAIVLMHADLQSPSAAVGDVLREAFNGPVLHAALAASEDVSWLQNQPCLAFSGIAHPEKFFDSLRRLGANLVEAAAYPDHHMFSADDAQSLLQHAERAGAQLVTTEKDWARLTAENADAAALRANSRALPVEVSFAEGSRNSFIALIKDALEPKASLAD